MGRENFNDRLNRIRKRREKNPPKLDDSFTIYERSKDGGEREKNALDEGEHRLEQGVALVTFIAVVLVIYFPALGWTMMPVLVLMGVVLSAAILINWIRRRDRSNFFMYFDRYLAYPEWLYSILKSALR